MSDEGSTIAEAANMLERTVWFIASKYAAENGIQIQREGQKSTLAARKLKSLLDIDGLIQSC